MWSASSAWKSPQVDSKLWRFYPRTEPLVNKKATVGKVCLFMLTGFAYNQGWWKSRGALVNRHELTKLIRKRIDDGLYPRGALLPPERSMAEDLGTSRPTLRRALEPLVYEGVLESQPGRGTLVVDASSPESREPWRILALLLPDIVNRFFGEVAEAIEYAALQRGYQILLCNSRNQLHLEEFHIRQLVRRRVDGVILAHQPHQEMSAAVPLLKAAGIPTVLLFSSAREADCDSVVLDDRAGVEQALRYLTSLGHQRIAFCRPLPGEALHPREAHYRDFMNRTVPRSTVRVLEILGQSDAEAQASLRSMLDRKGAPTACFAGNDNVALLLMRHLAAIGVSVPHDFSVVGFDNLRFVEHLPVPLTTVDQPKQEMGRRAAELLFERIEAGPGAPPRHQTFTPHLVIRESCAVSPAPPVYQRSSAGVLRTV